MLTENKPFTTHKPTANCAPGCSKDHTQMIQFDSNGKIVTKSKSQKPSQKTPVETKQIPVASNLVKNPQTSAIASESLQKIVSNPVKSNVVASESTQSNVIASESSTQSIAAKSVVKTPPKVIAAEVESAMDSIISSIEANAVRAIVH